MKKTLLSLAILGTLSGAAFAQTNVTIYGLVDTGISYNDNGNSSNNKTWKLDSGIQSGSRLGFKGSEDLGGGLSAIFTLENGFNADDGSLGQSTATTQRLFGRQAFVGLKGDFGSVKLGRQYNPIRPALESIDPFGLGLAGDARAMFSVYGERADNTINYTSPNVNGFVGQLAYSFGEIAGTTSAARQVGLSGAYANGPISAVLAYHYNNRGNATTPSNGTSKTTLLGGTYDFGVAKAHLGYAWNKGSPATGPDDIDTRDLLVGVSAPVGSAGTVLASYQRHTDKRIDNADSSDWAIGYTHALSKRTNLYTSYGKISNDDLATKGYVSTGAVAAGKDPSTFNVGIRHTF